LNIEKIITDYNEFLSDVSLEAERLVQQYEAFMVCRKGCCECCTDISLLPLEWFALKQNVKEAEKTFTPENRKGECSLLKNSICSFYPFRPLICRTHGLPLLYLTEEYDLEGYRTNNEEADWQISWCDLNFTSVTEDSMEEIFEPEDVLNMEEWNIRLRALNQDFLETPEGRAFQGKNRIPLQDLFDKS
jgi:Fe-S-cluster containining protein